MKYILAVYETAEDFQKRNDPQSNYWAGWEAYSIALNESGHAAGGAALEPPGTATTVRVARDARTVHDGPYAETKEQLGGFFIIDVPNLDAALEWAARCPAASSGAVEVRPVLPMMN